MLRHLCTFLTLLSLSLVVCASAQGTSWYADPNGLAANTGAINSPWDLKTALCKHSTIQPGDTLYLRGGTYHTYWGYNLDGYECIWRSSLAGSANAPIKVMSYPGEWAILDSGVGTLVNWVTLEVYGQYTWFQNLEIMDSNPTRYDTSTDTWTVSSGKNAGIEMGAGDPAVVGYTPGLKCINCLIHDTTCGMDIYRAGSGAEAYGNIISYNGWEGADRAHGHGLYTQNSGGAQNTRCR